MFGFSGTQPTHLFDNVTRSTWPEPWPNSPRSTSPTWWALRWFDDAMRGPQYGWYQAFQPWPRLAERVRCVAQATRTRRSPSRRCRADARRWKRRRFLHALRRSLHG